MSGDSQDGTATRELYAHILEGVAGCMRYRGLTNRQLSARLVADGQARSEPTVSRILRGKQAMTVEDLIAISAVLNVQPSEFIKRSETRWEFDHGQPWTDPEAVGGPSA